MNRSCISDLIGSTPPALNTPNKFATTLNDYANYAGMIRPQLGNATNPSDVYTKMQTETHTKIKDEPGLILDVSTITIYYTKARTYTHQI